MKRLGAIDYFNISVYAFALSVLWNGLGPLILPVRVLEFVPEAYKNTYLGALTFFGLVLAMFAQPLIGVLSDRSRSRWGRRRPYILAGTVLDLVFLAGIGMAHSYPVLLVTYLLLQLASNTTQAPYQAFIPDLVPAKRRGLASGAKNLAEIVGIIVVSLALGPLVGNYQSSENALWLGLALGSLAGVVLASMLLTVVTIKEEPLRAVSEASTTQALLNCFKIDPKGQSPFLWFLASRFFVIMAMTAIQTFALYFMQDVIGGPDPAAATGQVMAIIATGILLVVYPAGHLSDRVGRMPLVVFSGLVGALGSFLMVFAHSYRTVLAFASFLGVSIGVFLSSNWALATDIIPLEEGGRFLGLSNLATAGGGAAARLSGPMIDFFNAQKPGRGYTALFISCALYFLLGTVLLTQVRAGSMPAQRRPSEFTKEY